MGGRLPGRMAGNAARGFAQIDIDENGVTDQADVESADPIIAGHTPVCRPKAGIRPASLGGKAGRIPQGGRPIYASRRVVITSNLSAMRALLGVRKRPVNFMPFFAGRPMPGVR